jgi:hypothetical protein
MSTAFSPQTAGGKRYYLKAKSTDGRSAQHVGYAEVREDRSIAVTAVNGRLVGVARTRKEAGKMIDAHHREHNAEDYALWVGGKLI